MATLVDETKMQNLFTCSRWLSLLNFLLKIIHLRRYTKLIFSMMPLFMIKKMKIKMVLRATAITRMKVKLHEIHQIAPVLFAL